MHSIKFSRIDKQQFFATLRKRVNGYFKEENISKTGNSNSYLKAVIMLSLYLVPFGLLYTGIFTGWSVLILYVIMGIGTAGIGLCVMHDANHGSFAENKVLNGIMAYSMNLIGGSSFTWKVQHNINHHSFTNIYNLDEDIEDKPFLRLSPHGVKKGHHKFQHYYALFLYSLATLSWLAFKDFKQLIAYNKTGETKKHGFSPIKESVILTITKVLYFSLILFIPMFVVAKWYIILIGFLLLHIIAGFSITVVFQLAHVVEGPQHFTTETEDTLENTWAIHQINTTANFATQNKFLTWIVGGLNFQIEHHLFPNISHIHYPEIAKIVKQTVAEYNLPYYEFNTMGVALVSHLKMLRQFGNA